ncbi:GtrA family protein [Porphyromonas sp.]|uniref:GtrA family protein n=1 Tax=Porphyromonas sp. TaxID=1924944 RepID=UPI0026DBFB77|nr:GtrA family protein [Porphyromonas sp.]MDO4771615.1 GtrA family protein [Porphyromonas sp.]
MMNKAKENTAPSGSKYELLRQIVSYGIVGLSNTAITAIVIWICLKSMGMSPELSNVLGYAAGVINSFIWNSKYTFKTALGLRKFAIFLVVFMICYALQFGALLWLKDNTTIDSYAQQLIAMVVFNLANFVMNKFVTFKKK